MKDPENLIQVGKAILTPQAISFIETLQYEHNHIVQNYSKMLSEFICGSLILLNEGQVSDEVSAKLKGNANELATLALEIEILSKP